MTGLEKIKEKIESESAARCSEIIKSAENEGKKILEKAEINGKAYIESAVSSANAESEKIKAQAVSGAAQKSRQTILSAKVEVINETLEKVIDEIKNLDADKYFALVISQAKKNALKGKCTAFLGEKDLARVPSDFGKALSDALAEAGAECVLSDKCCNINSGLMLSYGDIEVNCSFEAIIDSMSDELKLKISEIIF